MDGTTDRSAMEREAEERDREQRDTEGGSADQPGGALTGEAAADGDVTDRHDVPETMTGEQGTDEGSREPAPDR